MSSAGVSPAVLWASRPQRFSVVQPGRLHRQPARRRRYPRDALGLQAEARILGISPITLKRAKLLLGVNSVKYSPRGPWKWQLPEDE